MIKNRNTQILSKEYKSTEQLKEFMEVVVGLKLRQVHGKDNAFWVTGEKDGDYIDGSKYYKIVFGYVTMEKFVNGPDGYQVRQVKEGYGFDLQATGDYNAWSMLGRYRDKMKEAIAEKQKKVAQKA